MVPLKLPREQKMEILTRLQNYFESELGESIGNLPGEALLDFMLEQLGPYIYNQAVRDARALAAQQMERLEEEMYALEKPLTFTKR